MTLQTHDQMHTWEVTNVGCCIQVCLQGPLRQPSRPACSNHAGTLQLLPTLKGAVDMNFVRQRDPNLAETDLCQSKSLLDSSLQSSQSARHSWIHMYMCSTKPLGDSPPRGEGGVAL